MASKKKQNEAKLWTKAKWLGFVNVNLTSQEKKAVKNALLSAEECFQFFMDAATAGYKVSSSYSIPEDVYTISLTGSYREKPNAGLTMSMRHRDFATAVTAVWWCLEEAGVNGSWEERFGYVDTDNW